MVEGTKKAFNHFVSAAEWEDAAGADTWMSPHWCVEVSEVTHR